MMVSLGSTAKRRHGFVDDGCQWHSRVEIRVGESDLSVSRSGMAAATVGCAKASFRWWDQRFGVGFQLSCGLRLWI